MDCLEAAKLLFEFFDDELEQDYMALLRSHLETCENCRCHFEFERSMMYFVASCCCKVKAPKKLKSKIKKHIKKM